MYNIIYISTFATYMGSLTGIGKLPGLGGWYFDWYFRNSKIFGGNSVLKIWGGLLSGTPLCVTEIVHL
jgi:hypothetical protein